MPIKIPNSLPAYSFLESENIFAMEDSRAAMQDIRPLRIAIVNVMPKKIVTETQLLRVLSNTPLQVDVDLLQMTSHTSKNTSAEHLIKFYKTFDDIKHLKYDGMIITGAPVEQMNFDDVHYWEELCQILDWAKENVFSSMFICWGAQAALYHYYGINKFPLKEKQFGIFKHDNLAPNHPLMRGFDEEFMVPHSRHTYNKKGDILNCENLNVLSYSEEAGVYMSASKDNRQFFITGHSEYDRYTLDEEYKRDINAGLEIKIPVNYYPDNDPEKVPHHNWRAHSHLLFSNWLNYFVYQETPYNLTNLK